MRYPDTYNCLHGSSLHLAHMWNYVLQRCVLLFWFLLRQAEYGNEYCYSHCTRVHRLKDKLYDGQPKWWNYLSGILFNVPLKFSIGNVVSFHLRIMLFISWCKSLMYFCCKDNSEQTQLKNAACRADGSPILVKLICWSLKIPLLKSSEICHHNCPLICFCWMMPVLPDRLIILILVYLYLSLLVYHCHCSLVYRCHPGDDHNLVCAIFIFSSCDTSGKSWLILSSFSFLHL